MKVAFQLIACWVLFSCLVGPVLTWAFFKRDRIERDKAEPDSSVEVLFDTSVSSVPLR